MKKLYVSPSVEVINIQATQLMASSGTTLSINNGPGSTPVNTTSDGVQLGRDDNSSSSIWDREW